MSSSALFYPKAHFNSAKIHLERERERVIRDEKMGFRIWSQTLLMCLLCLLKLADLLAVV